MSVNLLEHQLNAAVFHLAIEIRLCVMYNKAFHKFSFQGFTCVSQRFKNMTQKSINFDGVSENPFCVEIFCTRLGTAYSSWRVHKRSTNFSGVYDYEFVHSNVIASHQYTPPLCSNNWRNKPSYCGFQIRLLTYGIYWGYFQHEM